MTDGLEAVNLLKLRLDNALAMISERHPCRNAYAATYLALEGLLALAILFRDTATELERATGHSQASKLAVANLAIEKVRQSVSQIEEQIANH